MTSLSFRTALALLLWLPAATLAPVPAAAQDGELHALFDEFMVFRLREEPRFDASL